MKKIRSSPNKNPSKLIKNPEITRNESTEIKKPIFSLQYLDKDYCISCCEKDDKAAFADQLRALSQLTWAQLRQSNRHGLGYEKIERFALKGSLPSHITPDVNFLAFRFSGKKPMVGYREKEVFHIVWFDKDYSLYDHG